MNELVPRTDDVIHSAFVLAGDRHGRELSAAEVPEVLRSDELG